MPDRNLVTLEIYDVRGVLVERRVGSGLLNEGENMRLRCSDGHRPSAGVYLYRLRMIDPDRAVERASLTGKTVLVK